MESVEVVDNVDVPKLGVVGTRGDLERVASVDH